MADGHAVDIVGDGRHALEWAATYAYDLVILDVVLPGLDGFAVCAALRERRSPATDPDAHGPRRRRRTGSPGSTAAPTTTWPSRSAWTSCAPACAPSVGAGWRIARHASRSRTSCSIRRPSGSGEPGRAIHLTSREFALLELLARHPGQIFGRDRLIDALWDADFAAESNVVEVYIRSLRRKVDDGRRERPHRDRPRIGLSAASERDRLMFRRARLRSDRPLHRAVRDHPRRVQRRLLRRLRDRPGAGLRPRSRTDLGAGRRRSPTRRRSNGSGSRWWQPIVIVIALVAVVGLGARRSDPCGRSAKRTPDSAGSSLTPRTRSGPRSLRSGRPPKERSRRATTVDELRRALAVDARSAERLARITNDLLVLARADDAPTDRHDPIDLSVVVAETVEAFALAHPDLPRARLSLGTDLRVVADETEVSRIVANLLDNACRYAAVPGPNPPRSRPPAASARRSSRSGTTDRGSPPMTSSGSSSRSIASTRTPAVPDGQRARPRDRPQPRPAQRWPSHRLSRPGSGATFRLSLPRLG